MKIELNIAYQYDSNTIIIFMFQFMSEENSITCLSKHDLEQLNQSIAVLQTAIL